jgi:hypothetical protein
LKILKKRGVKSPRRESGDESPHSKGLELLRDEYVTIFRRVVMQTSRRSRGCSELKILKKRGVKSPRRESGDESPHSKGLELLRDE